MPRPVDWTLTESKLNYKWLPSPVSLPFFGKEVITIPQTMCVTFTIWTTLHTHYNIPNRVSLGENCCWRNRYTHQSSHQLDYAIKRPHRRALNEVGGGPLLCCLGLSSLFCGNRDYRLTICTQSNGGHRWRTGEWLCLKLRISEKWVRFQSIPPKDYSIHVPF